MNKALFGLQLVAQDPNYVLRRWYYPRARRARPTFRRRSSGVGAWLLRRLLWMVPTLLGITLVTFLAVHWRPATSARVGDAESASGGTEERAPARGSAARRAALAAVPALRRAVRPRRRARAFGRGGERAWHGLGGRPRHRVPAAGRARPAGDREAARGHGAARAARDARAVPRRRAARRRERALRGRARRPALARAPVRAALGAAWALELALVLAFGATGLAWLPRARRAFSGRGDVVGGARARPRRAPRCCRSRRCRCQGLAYVARQTRAAVLEVLDQDFVRAARAGSPSATSSCATCCATRCSRS